MTAVATRLWLVAGAVTGRPMPVDGPYPHLCGATYTGARSGSKPYRYQRRDCAACATHPGGKG